VQEVLPTAVVIAVRVWAQTGDYGSVRSDLLERVKRSLDKYGLSLTAEQRAVPPAQLIASK
jgi:small-conductance mechanosensitive channel